MRVLVLGLLLGLGPCWNVGSAENVKELIAKADSAASARLEGLSRRASTPQARRNQTVDFHHIATTNIALNKKTKMSSGSGGRKGVDGLVDSKFFRTNFSGTTDPW